MKQQLLNTVFIFSLIQFSLMAQKTDFVEVINYVKEIKISDIETTHLIFADEVEYIDVGNKYFATDVLKNIVKIKFVNTNNEGAEPISSLTIITKKGEYFSFKLLFDKENTDTSFRVLSSEFKIDQFNSITPEIDFKNDCLNILGIHENIKKKVSYQKMNFRVNGIYYIDDLIYIRVLIENKSRIDYTLDKIDFWIRSKKTNKRKLTAYQSRLIEPFYRCNYTEEIMGFNKSEMVFVFKRFVPLKNENFIIEITESGGGGRRGSIKLDIEDFLLN